MTIFAVLMPIPQPALIDEIRRSYPLDHLQLNETQFLVSANNITTTDLAVKLGVVNLQDPVKAPSGNAVIFATSSYFGRAPTTVWEWIKTKLEAPPSV